jgi:uncharacterized protein YciI
MEPDQKLFMVVRRYGGPYDPEKPLEAQLDWQEHRAFMNASEAEGVVRLAGPLEGGDEVLLVLRAQDESAINHHLAADPWTKSGILSTARIKRWNLRVGQVS